MTKEDYALIAATIKACIPKQNQAYYGHFTCDAQTLGYIASEMAINLAVENPRFDRIKFLQACGVHP